MMVIGLRQLSKMLLPNQLLSNMHDGDVNPCTL